MAFSETIRLKFPLMSVIIPFVVPFSTIFAPMIGSPIASFTTPVILRLLCCVTEVFFRINMMLLPSIAYEMSVWVKTDDNTSDTVLFCASTETLRFRSISLVSYTKR